MFFFLHSCSNLLLESWKRWRVREQEAEAIQNVDVSTFPVSVLVFPEYYFISKFEWKSDELWDCFIVPILIPH